MSDKILVTRSSMPPYEEYIEEIHKRKLYETGVDILPTDRLLTLCTCTYEYNDARLIVIARMVRDGESTQVNTNLADYKTEPVKYPDSYYDNPNSNPYKNDKKTAHFTFFRMMYELHLFFCYFHFLLIIFKISST